MVVDFPGTAYDRWKTEPPEPKKNGSLHWTTDRRGKKKKVWVSDEDMEIMNADDRYDAEKNGDY